MKLFGIEKLLDVPSALTARLATRQAQYVGELTDDKLRWAEQGVGREVIIRSLVAVLPHRFLPEIGGDIDGVLELRFVDPAGGEPDQIQISMNHGKCRAARNGTKRPDVTATMHLSDLVRLAAAAAEAGWLLNDGRITLTGDYFIFVRFPACFGLKTVPLYAPHRGPSLVGPLSPPR